MKSVVVKCDRCGAEEGTHATVCAKTFEVTILDFVVMYDENRRHYDLCKDCRTLLRSRIHALLADFVGGK